MTATFCAVAAFSAAFSACCACRASSAALSLIPCSMPSMRWLTSAAMRWRSSAVRFSMRPSGRIWRIISRRIGAMSIFTLPLASTVVCRGGVTPGAGAADTPAVCGAVPAACGATPAACASGVGCAPGTVAAGGCCPARSGGCPGRPPWFCLEPRCPRYRWSGGTAGVGVGVAVAPAVAAPDVVTLAAGGGVGAPGGGGPPRFAPLPPDRGGVPGGGSAADRRGQYRLLVHRR